MVGLVTGVSSVLGSLGGGGNPLSSIAGEEGGAVSSAATASGTQTATTGAFNVGSDDGSKWLWVAGALLVGIVIARSL